ncbi:Uncharacterised protein [Klebsiella oxytoca]|nr:Uncharacterised protein [Klebsiella oxytoca]
MAAALRQLVQCGIIQLTLRHRGKDRCRLADRPAGAFHPTVPNLDTVERSGAHGQGLGGFLPGALHCQLPALRFQYRDTLAPFQPRLRNFPQHRQTFTFRYR